MNKLLKILSLLIKIPRRVEILIIKMYKKYISPFIGNHCKYYPTCSEYMCQAVDKYGIIKGNILGLIRLLKCNPFSHGGIDYLK